MTILIIIGVILGGGIAVFGAMTVRQEEDTVRARINRYDLKPARSLTELELQIPRIERLFAPWFRKVARLVRRITPVGRIERSQQILAQAGNPRNLTVQDFLGLKGVIALGLGALGFFVVSILLHMDILKAVLGTAAGLFLGFQLPDLWLRQSIKKRQKAIQKYLPDAIDLLAISVQAGQGFDGALETLSRRKQNALTAEFDRFRMETQAGKGRREAFRDLSARTGVEDMQGFVAAMIQADQLGIGVSQVLRTQSEELRIKRRQRAEEKAHQAPIKMLFPLIFLMFPALFIVILGPAVPKLAILGHV
ncbi:MAG: type II secretion system F family protein [Chloroflexota bacterium]